ncbi:trans-sulfuration enzyme family protein [Phaeodactylibacter xiamenensis]|jgi:cystathionine beta-lyase/cystathionine gamma-synthase|uniref:trans-sulfuration enzyme family protein n=1 Tax=Phaeodactylibacter xiamenensis TaxID=1524460 RepID=UPI0024A89745|nr:aminotransferase class I/II-fold pyridoxal phosphate-dependent enzyme [Phaeodactylibacter xiamenensis]
MHLSEILMHLGEDRHNYFNAVSPPVMQTSNFAFNTLDDFRQAIAQEAQQPVYSRGVNPTVAILRKKLAALEHAEDALVFGSGMAAISAAILAHCKADGHVVCVAKPYSWTHSILVNYLPRFGVSHTFVDGTGPEQIEAAIQSNTTLLYLESPNSMTFELQDLEACAAIAKKHGIPTCIDNSYASPVFQNPIDFGIDMVVHSGTKYLNGHSDVVFGVLCGSYETIGRVFAGEYMTLGGILSPHDASLVIRGLRTLELRMQRTHESALEIARQLEGHPAVGKVLHPWLSSFPQYELARRQMTGAGGLFSFYLDADTFGQAERFFEGLERFLLAVSWGGHESLVMPATAFYGVPGREDSTTPWNLVRLYIGLEDPAWLWEGLEKGFQHMRG